jgi:hypothetical protein
VDVHAQNEIGMSPSSQAVENSTRLRTARPITVIGQVMDCYWCIVIIL